MCKKFLLISLLLITPLLIYPMDRQERLNATFESVKATMVTSFDEVYKLSRDTARLRKSTTEVPITPAQEEDFVT